MKIILASKSKARKQLLSESGLKFDIVPADIDEKQIKDPVPSRRVKKLALLKAKTVLERLSHEGYGENVLIIAADTMVYFQNKFIGKPRNKKEAKEILRKLSGSTHWLYTGICVVHVNCHCEEAGEAGSLAMTKKVFLDFDKTKVTFRKLADLEIDSYVKNPKVLNHAGGYTIEKNTVGEGFIKQIKGSYSNVLGLPIEKLRRILTNLSDLSDLGNLGNLTYALSSSLYKKLSSPFSYSKISSLEKTRCSSFWPASFESDA